MKLKKLIITLGLGACILMTGCGSSSSTAQSGGADTSSKASASAEGADIQKILEIFLDLLLLLQEPF